MKIKYKLLQFIIVKFELASVGFQSARKCVLLFSSSNLLLWDFNYFHLDLTAFVYNESECSKGGTNLVSLFMDNVRTIFSHEDQISMKELNMIMDNCARQNLKIIVFMRIFR